MLNGKVSFENIADSLKRAGLTNKVNKPNDDAHTEVEFKNIPNSLISKNKDEIFDLNANLDEFDQGEYNIFVIRKEVRDGKSGADHFAEKRPNLNDDNNRLDSNFTYTVIILIV